MHYGKNWTWVELKTTLQDVSQEVAMKKIEGLNTIAALTYHIHYFVRAALEVLEGRPLDAHDKYSFDAPDMRSDDEWQSFLKEVFSVADRFASAIETLPEDKWGATFFKEKYGTYFSNVMGIIEHTHYHLGQIVVIKKLIHSQE